MANSKDNGTYNDNCFNAVAILLMAKRVYGLDG